jgi:hypothetical protein
MQRSQATEHVTNANHAPPFVESLNSSSPEPTPLTRKVAKAPISMAILGLPVFLPSFMSASLQRAGGSDLSSYRVMNDDAITHQMDQDRLRSWLCCRSVIET